MLAKNVNIDRNINYAENEIDLRVEFIKARLDKVQLKLKSDLEAIGMNLKEYFYEINSKTY